MAIANRFSPTLVGIILLLLALQTASAFASKSATSPPLKLAIFPYFSAAQLIKLHKPLKDHLATFSKQDIRMTTATSFNVFKQHTAAKKYDIIVTAPHLGRLAQRESGYRLLGFTSNTSYAVFAADKEHAHKPLSSFKGRAVTLPPTGAIIHHLALNRLKNAGLEPGKDIKINTTTSHNNAMISVIEKISPLAAFGKPTWAKFQPKGRENLVEIARSEAIPGFAILIHPRIDERLQNQLLEAMLTFETRQQGKTYYANTGLKGFRKARISDLKTLDFYLAEIAHSNTTSTKGHLHNGKD